MITPTTFAGTFLLLALFGQTDGDAARKQIEKVVTQAAVKFYNLFEGRDLEALLTIVDTPWYHDGKSILHSKTEIQSEFKALLDKRRDVKTRKVPDVKTVLAYGSVRERTDPQERKLLDQVLKETDYLVLVMLKPEQGAAGVTENVVLLVKYKDNVAKVIGVKN